MLNCCGRTQDPARILEAELSLQSQLLETKKEVRRCLCDDFDTPGAVVALQDLVKAVNKVNFFLYADVKMLGPGCGHDMIGLGPAARFQQRLPWFRSLCCLVS